MKHTVHFISFLLLLVFTDAIWAADNQKRKKLPLVVAAPVTQNTSAEWLERRAVLKPLRLVKVLNEEPGRVIEIRRFEGDHVTAGELLARQDDGLVRAEWLKLKARKEQLLEEWKRYQILKQEGMVSAEVYGQSRTLLKVAIAEERLLAKRLAYMQITAPLNGVVSERLVEEGDVAERYRHLFSIMDIRRLKSRVALESDQLNRLSRQSAVLVSSEIQNGKQYPARISRIFPALDEQTHQATVEIELLPGFDDLRPGQLVTIRLGMQSGSHPSIPMIALRQDQAGSYVFRLQPDYRVERIAVTPGRFQGERVEILKGLSASEQVVVRGFSGLKSGQQVEVVAADGRP
ncbi:MAG: efflux RND transporter periplasmic adaptor subunit [Gammaproteobacteria bacterium]|nr:efflux RND transporter periplasmic adaptor subunit [Gammaproteobacteria bacterium]